MDAKDNESEPLCTCIQEKLQRWASLGEAPEYYLLKNRGPHKPVITHPLNRFGGNMGPYADALLPLQSVEYINASPIDNLGDGTMPFVATMCPKRETFAHFWSMVWELGSRVIINLTHEKDRVGSGPSDKRERYWPPFEDANERHLNRWPVRPYTIGTETCEQVPALVRYTIELRGPPTTAEQGGERPRRVVYLYWYSRWVDFPSSTSIGSRPFYANAWAVLHIGLHVAAELDYLGAAHWMICHCSAGVGRTGTFLGLLHLLRLLPKLRDEEGLDAAVTATIEAMRERRLWMVKTDIEYATLYAALLLRLRNPDDAEFALSWPLKDGQRVPLLPATEAAGGGGSGGVISPSGVRGRHADDEDAAADELLPEAEAARRPAKRATGAAGGPKASPPVSAAGSVGAAAAPPPRDASEGGGDACAAGDAVCDGNAATAEAAEPIAEEMEQEASDTAPASEAGGVATKGGGASGAVRAPAAVAPPSAGGGEPSPAAAAGGGWGGGDEPSPASPSGLRVRTPDDEEMDDETDMAIDNARDVANYAGVGMAPSYAGDAAGGVAGDEPPPPDT